MIGYSLKSDPEPEDNTYEDLYDCVDWNDDIEGYKNSDNIKADLYSLKLIALQEHYGDKFKSDIVDNQLEYEKFFEDNFEFAFDVYKW